MQSKLNDIEIGSRLVVARGRGLGGVEETDEGCQRIQTSYEMKSSGDVTYSMVTIVNNTVMYI